METVKSKLKAIGCFILILANYSCSFLCKVPVLESSKSPEWKECGICYKYSQMKLSTKSYQFIADSCLITICPCAKPGFNFLFGPPFIPIIPNPLIILPVKPNSRFFIDLKVDNKERNLTLDLSNFQFEISKDTLTKPSLIKLLSNENYGHPEESLYQRDYFPDDSILSNPILKVTHPLIIRFEFSVLTTKVKHLSVRYDSIPEIKFRKRSKFVYKPFVFAS